MLIRKRQWPQCRARGRSRPAVRPGLKKAIERKTGARGLRGILEETLGKLMYEVPSDPTVVRVAITADTVEKKGEALIVRDPERRELSTSAPKKVTPRANTAS